jgi:hypothetical protein
MKIKIFIFVIAAGLTMIGTTPIVLAGSATVAPTAPAAPSAPVASSPSEPTASVAPTAPIAPSPLAPTAPTAPEAPPASTAPSAPVPNQTTNITGYGNTNSVYWITNAPYGNPVSGYTNTTYLPPMSKAQ